MSTNHKIRKITLDKATVDMQPSTEYAMITAAGMQWLLALKDPAVAPWCERIEERLGQPLERSICWIDTLLDAKVRLYQQLDWDLTDADHRREFDRMCHEGVHLSYNARARLGLWVGGDETLLREGGEDSVRQVLEHCGVAAILIYTTHAYLKVIQEPHQ